MPEGLYDVMAKAVLFFCLLPNSCEHNSYRF